jgi:flagellar protein FlbD
MIELTRLNGSPLVVNSELIQYVESAPDTTLTLVNGEKVVVRESPAAVIDVAAAFRARILGEAGNYSRSCTGSISDVALHELPAETAGQRNQIEAAVDYVARRRAIQE